MRTSNKTVERFTADLKDCVTVTEHSVYLNSMYQCSIGFRLHMHGALW